jgi:putative nucleotidyltransferase with HDIG domain
MAMELAVAARIASEYTGRLQLSVFPYLLERLIHSHHELSAELPVLSRLIRMDPALCFLAMRLDRSMGSNSQVSDTPGVDDVVRRIGMDGIDAITAQALADQALTGIHHQQGMALGWLWRHSLTTAMLAQGLAIELNFRMVAEAYTAGLLHDIGKLALFARTPAACAPMLTDPAQASPLLKAEERVAGFDHGQIGAQLIHRYTGAWLAADAARYHTVAGTAVINALPLVQLVWSANRLAVEPHPSPEAYQMVARLLDLDPHQLSQLSQTVQERILAVVNELGVAPDQPEKSRVFDTLGIPLSQDIKTRTVLSHVYKELLAASDLTATIRILRQSLSAFMGIDALIVLEYEPRRRRLIGRYAAGNVYPPQISRLQIPLNASQCLPVTCHVNGKAVNSFSSAHRGKLTIIDKQLMAYMQKDGIVCMPIRSTIGDETAILLLGVDAGDWPWVEQHSTLLKAIAAAVAGVLESARQRDDQKDNRAADRMASTASRTREIVHEINNPLSIIKNYLKVLTLHSDEHASSKDALRIIDEEINRVAGLIRSLTTPSEKIPIVRETVDVNATVTDILVLIRTSLTGETGIRLDVDLDPLIPVIVSDRNRLKQALINLLKNAMEAIPGGGTIQVRTRLLSNAPQHPGDPNEAGRIKISVCDNGPGIEEDIKNDLFKPNVTSKTGHDGLGLPIVLDAVTHINGSLLCDSSPGQGTCFHIELPVGDNGS